MARDEQFTTFSVWECLFGLSVTARYFWRGVGRLDNLCGSPLNALVNSVQRRWFNELDAIHPMALGKGTTRIKLKNRGMSDK